MMKTKSRPQTILEGNENYSGKKISRGNPCRFDSGRPYQQTINMKKLSKSPDRNTFQLNCFLGRCESENKDMNSEEVLSHIEFYRKINEMEAEREQNAEWVKSNLEADLRSTDWILEKVRSSDSYAQNLYAALCNNAFVHMDIVDILKEKESWSCSWRYAGGIVANMLQRGDYIDWYCSGIRNEDELVATGYVNESVVTDEIKEDLLKLNWIIDKNYADE